MDVEELVLQQYLVCAGEEDVPERGRGHLHQAHVGGVGFHGGGHSRAPQAEVNYDGQFCG